MTKYDVQSVKNFRKHYMQCFGETLVEKIAVSALFIFCCVLLIWMPI